MKTITYDLQQYLTLKEQTLRPNSYKVYRNFGHKFTQFISDQQLADLPTAKLKPEHCVLYRDYVLKLHADTCTRNKEINQLKIFLNHLTKPGYQRFQVSPARHVSFLPSVESEMHEPYTESEVAAIFGEIIARQDHYLLLYIYFIHYTFSRPGREVRLLKVGDLKARRVLIQASHSKTRRRKMPTIPKPLESLIDALGVRNYPKDWYVFGCEGTPGPVPVGNGCYYHRHRKVLEHLSLTGQKHTLYGWKHTGNIRAVQLGISDRTLIDQNGFTQSKTLDIYLRRLSVYANDEIYDKFV